MRWRIAYGGDGLGFLYKYDSRNLGNDRRGSYTSDINNSAGGSADGSRVHRRHQRGLEEVLLLRRLPREGTLALTLRLWTSDSVSRGVSTKTASSV